jgi:hypothetical protein
MFTTYYTTNNFTNCMPFILRCFSCWEASRASQHEKQRTQIQDMLPQQYYKVEYLITGALNTLKFAELFSLHKHSMQHSAIWEAKRV